MRVLVNKVVYDSNLVPVLLVLEDGDKKNIGSMLPENKKYLSYPPQWTQDELQAFLASDEFKGVNNENVFSTR